MNCATTLHTATVLGLAILGLGSTAAARADVMYHVSVNTSGIAGVNGFASFALNFGNSPAQAATATVSHFTTDGTLTGPTVLFGGASGDLSASPFALTIQNTANPAPPPGNDGDQPIAFGNHLSFDVTLSGPAINTPDPLNPNGTTFSFFLYDSTFEPLLTDNPNGSVLDIDIPPFAGPVTVTTYTNNGGPSVVTVAQVPEPGTLLLVGLGLVGCLGRGGWRPFSTRRV